MIDGCYFKHLLNAPATRTTQKSANDVVSGNNVLKQGNNDVKIIQFNHGRCVWMVAPNRCWPSIATMCISYGYQTR